MRLSVVTRTAGSRPPGERRLAAPIQKDSGLSKKCRTQACSSTCAVKRSHLAPLATKGFFGKCQKPEQLKFPVALPLETHAGHGPNAPLRRQADSAAAGPQSEITHRRAAL